MPGGGRDEEPCVFDGDGRLIGEGAYPQEFIRVMLNLFSNGFYAVTRKAQDGAGTDFQPALTAAAGAGPPTNVLILVRDNGTGTPDNARARLFAPFFTTKPAGEGPASDPHQPRHHRETTQRQHCRRRSRRRLHRVHNNLAAHESRSAIMNLLIFVVDDEPDVEALLRQQFRSEMRAGRFMTDFASSGAQAIEEAEKRLAAPALFRHQHARNDAT